MAWKLAEQGCTGGTEPLVVERDGVFYPSCITTGVVYAPPFTGAGLIELLFPDAWSIIPPG